VKACAGSSPASGTNDFKGLGFKGLPLFCGGFLVGVHIGVHYIHFQALRGLECFPVYGVVPLESAPGPLAGRRHDPEIVRSSEPHTKVFLKSVL
jgi:hypothetical protein